MTGRRPYVAPAVVATTDVLIVDDSSIPITVPTTLAVAVALSYALRSADGALAAMIYPCRARLRWTSLPKTAQGLFGSICEELRLGDISTDLVRKAMFR